MKKSLALVLALVMVLSSFSFVSAAPDFADVAGTKYENAVARLELLEILKGYPDGTFKPEGSITRAEFAAVAVRAKGLAGVAEAAAGLPSGFSDVPASHWAAGYVGTAGSTGVVQGIGGGLFAPNAPVKYEEAVTMLVRALGYEPEAQSKGGYPFGYLVVAEEIGLLDGARSTTGTFATRGLVALLTDNAMEIPMMVSIGFGDNIRWVVSGSKAHGGDAEYLLGKLGVDEFEGIVMANFMVNSRLDEEEITLYDLNDEKNITLEVSPSVDISAILGLEVTAWAKDDVVFAVTVETDSDLIAYDSVAGVTEDDVDLLVLDDTFEWAMNDADYDDATVYVNNVSVDLDEATGFGRFVMNSDNEIVFAYLFDFEDYGVVSEIDATDMEFASVVSADFDTLELDAAEEIYVFTKEMSAMSLEDVAKDMSVFFWIDADDNYFIMAFEAMAEGTLEEIRTRDSRINVEGTTYLVAVDGALFSDDEMDTFARWTKNDYALIEDYLDEEVVVYLDVDGRAMVLTTDVSVSSTVYGIVTWWSEGRTDTLTIFNKDGEEVTYNFDDRNYMPTEFPTPDVKGTTQDIVGVKLTLNKDGEITAVDMATSEKPISKEQDKERVMIDDVAYYLLKDTIIMKAYDDEDGKLEPSILKYEDMVKLAIAATDDNSVQFITKGTSKDLALVIFEDVDFQATDDTMYAIATGDRFVRNGDYRIELDVVGEGKAVYTLAGAPTIAKGNLVTFEMNNKGEAVVDVVNATTRDVLEVLTNYFTVATDGEYRVTSKTLFYKVSSTGSLDGTTTFSRIDLNDRVKVLANDEDEAMVVVDYTPQLGQAVPAVATFEVAFQAHEGAVIVVGGKTVTGYTIQLAAGTYAYTITTPGYETVTGEVKVVDKAVFVANTFVALPALAYEGGDDLFVTLSADEANYRVVIGGIGYEIVDGVVDLAALGFDDGELFEAKLVAVSAPTTAIVTESFFYDAP